MFGQYKRILAWNSNKKQVTFLSRRLMEFAKTNMRIWSIFKEIARKEIFHEKIVVRI